MADSLILIVKSRGLWFLFPSSRNFFTWFNWDFCWFVGLGFFGGGSECHSVFVCLFV